MKRRGVVVLLLCGLCAATALAKPGVVKTTDGQTYSGEIDESNPESITVTSSSNIPTAVPRNRIATIEYAEDFEKKFRDRLSKLPPKDVPGRLKLAREAYDNRQYVLARDVAEEARQIDPNNAEAADLVNSIQSQIRLERQHQQQLQQQQAAAGAGGTGGADAGGEVTTTQPMAERLLKPDQINAIRQAELRPDDAGVRIRFERDVKRRFMDYTGRTPQEINQMSINDLVQEIIKKGTPEMRRDVIIQNDPPAMMEFRRNVQPFVLNNCATSGCHGTINPAKFSLITPGDSDAAMYTNFYTLQNYKKQVANAADNVFSRGELRMIDRQGPAQSLLLQNGLPGAIAEFDHPEVPGFRAPYRGLNDPRYQLVLRWIGESLVPVPPDYGFTHGPSLATQPAAPAPAAAAATAPAGPPTPRPATRPAPQPPRPPTVAPPPPSPQPQPRGGGGAGARPAGR
jgi:hypothetical protein